MTNVLRGSNDQEKLADLSNKTYKEQAIWFLNAFWEDFGQAQADKIWQYKHQMDELDLAKKAEGSALDELQAHRFLEKFNETMTVAEMRDKLRSTGAIGAAVKLVPLVHILVFKYKVDWKYLVNAPQGSKEEVAKAQALLDEVSAAFEASEARAREAAASLKESQSKEADAKRREAEAKRTADEAKARDEDAKAKEEEAIAREAAAREQEAPFKAAQEEVDAALADVKAQEDARNSRTEELKRKSTEGGVVQQNKAKAELAQHLAEDPLPLRKAKITLEAALKKAEKARAPFEAATKQAEAAREVAEKAANAARSAKAASEKAKREADEAVEEASRRVAEAEAYLNEIRSRPGSAHGAMWWMDRTLTERKAYLPESKGGYKKQK